MRDIIINDSRSKLFYLFISREAEIGHFAAVKELRRGQSVLGDYGIAVKRFTEDLGSIFEYLGIVLLAADRRRCSHTTEIPHRSKKPCF